MRKLITLTVLLALSGCAAPYTQQCQQLGFPAGTPANADCALQLHHDAEVGADNAVAAYLLFH